MLFKSNSIYEINARLLVKRFQVKSLLEVPADYWKELSSIGINYIWLMGAWKIPESSINKYCFEEGLIKEYKKALPNWHERDVAGSPYAIEDYVINPCLGQSNYEFGVLKKKLNNIGLKLILDFIPNHFNAESRLLKTNPEIFLRGDEFVFEEDSRTFFRSPFVSRDIFVHGKDPNFDAWQDTIQVNYFSADAKEFMIGKLHELAKICDGIRCDMAMLVMNEIFKKTWGHLTTVTLRNHDEFWKLAISRVKNTFPEFLFIAEAYWGLEWELQQQGFDYTYDKRLYDRLLGGNVQNIKEHLKADENYQKCSLRFIENHDEKRAANVFDGNKLKAAALIISTLPGISFYFDGQFTGKKIKLPIQLNREPVEPIDKEIQNYYLKMFNLLNEFNHGNFNWELLDTLPAWDGNFTHNNFLCWKITGDNKNIIVCVNYSQYISQCRIKPEITSSGKTVVFKDILNKAEYERDPDDVMQNGLYVELHEFGCHLFDL